MAMLKLTKTAVDGLVFAGKTDKHLDVRWDLEVKGFGVRVWASGERTFLLCYRHHGRKRFLTLGRYGALTLAQARDLARERLGDVARGRDPAGERKDELHAATLGDFLERYLKLHSEARKAEDSQRNDRILVDQHITPAIGHLKLRAVNRADVARLHAQIGATKRKVRKRVGGKVVEVEVGTGKTTTANRVLSLLSNAFEKAKLWGAYPEALPNPARGVERFPETRRQRFVRPDEMPALGAAIDQEQNVYVKAAIWLYLLTGLRKNAVLRLEWKEVDFETGVILLPPEKTKNRQHHAIPITTALKAVLWAIPRLDGNPYVIVGARKGHHLVNITKPWDRIRERAGLADVRLHDLRHTVASWMINSGSGLELIQRTLGHSSRQVTERYAHLALTPVATAMEAHGTAMARKLAERPRAHQEPRPGLEADSSAVEVQTLDAIQASRSSTR